MAEPAGGTLSVCGGTGMHRIACQLLYRAWVRQALALLVAFGWWTGAWAAAPQPANGNPNWSQLSAEYKAVLAPLAAEWDKLEPARKRKWLGIAKRYPKMSAKEQERAQRRMTDWIKLSPEQRREARQNYRRIGKLPPEKRSVLREKWAEYQALPPEARQNLLAPAEKPAVKRRARSKPTPAE